MKKLLLLLTLGFISICSNAQRFFGLNQSNYSGVQGMLLNPAKVATSRQIFNVNLFTVNAAVNNNNYLINKDSIRKGVFKYTVKNPNAPLSLVAPYFETVLPSLSLTVGNRLGFGFSTRLRLFNQLHNANLGLINAFNGISSGAITAINDNIGFNYNMHAITDIGFTGSLKLFDEDKMALTAGTSIRYYRGIGFVNFNNKGIVGKYIDNPNQGPNQPDYLQISNIDLSISTSAYDYKNIQDQFTSAKDAFSALFGSKTAGKGLGFDVGAEFILKNDKHQDYSNAYKPYTLKAGLSILDIGTIKYKGVKQAIIKGTGTLNIDSVNFFSDNIQSLREYTKRRGLTTDSATLNAVKVSLPTTLNAYVDYGITKNVFVTASTMINLVSRSKNNPYYNSQFTIAPRFETKVFDVSLPISYNTMSKDIKLGAAFRIGILQFGSDDLSLAFKNSKGGNVYAGLRFGLNKRNRKKDINSSTSETNSTSNQSTTNNNTVTNNKTDSVIITNTKTVINNTVDTVKIVKVDTVTKVLTITFDRDKDGIVDSIDNCPDVAGLMEYKGCPAPVVKDMDKDGVPDEIDECKNVFGLASLNGCPDRDGDLVADYKDKCPDVKGLVSLQGCPEIKEAIKKRIDYAAKAIQFNSGKSTLLPTSLSALNNVIAILKEYTDYNLNIEGHTDNVGKPDANLLLSQNRALAVKQYLIANGIAAERLNSVGFGDAVPLVANTNPQNKAINRRVQMSLELKK